MQHKGTILPGLLLFAAVTGCGGGGGGDDLPNTPPTTVELVVDEAFTNAGGIAVSSDGEEFYVLATDADGKTGIFTVDVVAKTAAPLHVGDLLYPSDVAISCDDETLFVSDMGAPAAEYDIGGPEGPGAPKPGGIYTVSTGSGELAMLPTTGIGSAAGVVVSTDCASLFVSGFTPEGMPAVWKLATAGGAAEIVHSGAPLVSPTTLHVDADQVVWLMDHGARGDEGEGSLFAITPAGEVSSAASGLAMGRIGGVSLVPGGLTAVVPVNEEGGRGMLVTANTQTGAKDVMPTPDASFLTGTAAARSAPVMGLATESGAIFQLGF
jgi:DNA-binding beta-propeller fold protein YncE